MKFENIFSSSGVMSMDMMNEIKEMKNVSVRN